MLENYSEDKSLHEIAIIITESVFYIKPDEFILGQTKNLTLGTEFLYTEEPSTWREAEKELAPAFRDFPDTCFCLAVSDGEAGGQYRVLFFNGKWVKQYPEIRYPEFHLNDFEYQASEKIPLESDYDKVAAIIKDVAEKKRSVEGAVGEARALLDLPPLTPDPVEIGFIKKKYYFGDTARCLT
jgi:hypothetical protein